MTYSTSNTSGALMSRKDAANYLGVSPQTLAAWACNRRYGPPFVKIDRRVMYLFADLQTSSNATLSIKEYCNDQY